MSNLNIWNSVSKTDPEYTKSFSRGGGFKGTAINPTYLFKQATEVFGPAGLGWGVNITNEEYVDGAPGDKVHVVRIKLWYLLDGKRGEIESFGQTTFCGKNKNGAFTDEEAPKKSLTDATTKALSLLGFAADVHLGLYDDNKYVNNLRDEFADQKAANDDKSTARKRSSASKEAMTYDDVMEFQTWLEGQLKDCDNVKAVTDLMTDGGVKSDLAEMTKADAEHMREMAKARMVELGWEPPSKKQAQ